MQFSYSINIELMVLWEFIGVGSTLIDNEKSEYH